MKNTQRLVILFSLLLVILVALGYFALSLNAQVPFDPKKRAEQSADKDAQARGGAGISGPVDVTKIFPKDKGGCGMKLSTFFVMSNYYIGGTKVEDVANNKIFEPLVKSVYDKVSKVGIEKATIGEMKEFSSCVSNAKPHKSASIEYDLDLKYKPCRKLNNAVLDILDYIKRRRNVNSIISKYEKINIDFTGTAYEDTLGIIALFAGQLAIMAKNSEYKDVVTTGLGVVVACYR